MVRSYCCERTIRPRSLDVSLGDSCTRVDSGSRQFRTLARSVYYGGAQKRSGGSHRVASGEGMGVRADAPVAEEVAKEAQEAREAHQVRDAYGLALACLLASALALIMAGAPIRSPIAIAAALFQVVALVLTLRVSGVRRNSYRGGMAFVALVFASGAWLLSTGTEVGSTIAVAVWLALIVGTIAAIAKRLATYRAVTLQLVLGLLCVYVLIGLSFGFAFLLIEIRDPAAFTASPLRASGCLYYSFITLATVGYGDISPVSSVARGLAVAEAILGQLYLVSVVSLAVSRLGRGKRSEFEESE